MIASTLVAAALASTNPAQSTPAAAAAHDHSAMAKHHDMSGHKDMAAAKGMAEGKMDCCKDGCSCCAKKDAAKAPAR